LRDLRQIKKFGSLSLITTLHRHKNGTLVPFRVNATYDDSVEERIFAFYHNVSDIAEVSRELEDLRKLHREQGAAGHRTRQLLVSVSEETLRQIGRDLHDDMGQILTGGAPCWHGTLAKTISNCCRGAVGDRAEALAGMLGPGDHQRLRAITHGLYPVAIDARAGLFEFDADADQRHAGRSPNARSVWIAAGPEPVLDEETLLHIYQDRPEEADGERDEARRGLRDRDFVALRQEHHAPCTLRR
jgi:hypothetical protein